METSLAESYYEKLTTTDNPVAVLTAFYCKLIGVPTATPDMYAMMSKLYSIYGHRIIFFSLLDCVDVPDFGQQQTIGLITYFAKKRLEKSTAISKEEDLRLIAKRYLAPPRKTPLKIISPFEE